MGNTVTFAYVPALLPFARLPEFTTTMLFTSCDKAATVSVPGSTTATRRGDNIACTHLGKVSKARRHKQHVRHDWEGAVVVLADLQGCSGRGRIQWVEAAGKAHKHPNRRQ